MGHRNLIVGVLLFAVLGLFFPPSVFAMKHQEASQLGFNDASSECPLMYKDNFDPSTVSKANREIKAKQKSQSMYESKGYQNDSVPWQYYNDQFVTTCLEILSEQAKTIESGRGGDDDNPSVYNRLAEAGRSNVDCFQDGINDAKNNKPKTRPNEIIVEGRILVDKDLEDIKKAHANDFYEFGFGAYYLGCKDAYNSGYDQYKKGSSESANAKSLGFKDGSNDFECRREGVNDFKNDQPRELNIFEVNARQDAPNPYDAFNPLDFEDYNQYRVGYEDGCKATYNSAYDTEKRKAVTGGSLFDDDDLGGCLIATAAYGTELAPEVQNLRAIRNQMYTTEAGGELMHAVNDFYYLFSPTVADWERQNPVFKESVKILITPSMTSFMILDHKTIDSEEGLIGYVVSIVLLNAGMYFVAPALIAFRIKKRIRNC